jgi:L-ascorbate 6-phosphate lactonase
MGLMRDIQAFTVPAKSLAVWWLGQAGFIIKSPAGKTVVIDPYLSDVCSQMASPSGLNFFRAFPSPLAGEDLTPVDLYVVTHSHQDHLDTETLKPYLAAGGRGPFLAPPEAAALLTNKLGVSQSQITLVWPNKLHTIGDMTFRATLAVPYGSDDLNHVGYLISIQDGPTVYFTGDTAYHEVIGISVAEYKPDVMFTVINGMWRNLSPSDAARLADQIKPKLVIPYHYDLFPDGQMPPHVLRLNLLLYQMQDRFKTIEVGKPFVYTV